MVKNLKFERKDAFGGGFTTIKPDEK